MGELLDKQHRFFLQNGKMLSEKHEGRFVVIHDEQVADSFGSERDAYIYSVSNFQVGTFLIREVVTKSSAES